MQQSGTRCALEWEGVLYFADVQCEPKMSSDFARRQKLVTGFQILRETDDHSSAVLLSRFGNLAAMLLSNVA